jgi:hypothetical protein
MRSWQLWPFPRIWQVTSHTADHDVIAMMRLNGRTRAMVFGHVQYLPSGRTAK